MYAYIIHVVPRLACAVLSPPMFSQFRNVVEGLAQPRPQQPSPRRSPSLERARSSSPAKSLVERHLKAKLEDRLRASFTVGEASNPTTPAPSSRVSPAPQSVTEHPLSSDLPLQAAAIPLPSTPPNDHNLDHDYDPPSDASFTLLSPPLTVSPEVPDMPVPADHGSDLVMELESINQSSPPKSPLADAPIISHVPEQKMAAPEEDAGVCDANQSTVTTSISQDEPNIVSNASSVVETAPANQQELVQVPIPVEESQSGNSVDVETLRERLQLMEQKFTGQWYPFSLCRPRPLIRNRYFCVVCGAAN
jgi:hypothetical protein